MRILTLAQTPGGAATPYLDGSATPMGGSGAFANADWSPMIQGGTDDAYGAGAGQCT